jgi:hypothetical protein
VTKEEEKPTELSKISALLRAVRKLNTEFNTRIKILEDKLNTLDFEATVIALKERQMTELPSNFYRNDWPTLRF